MSSEFLSQLNAFRHRASTCGHIALRHCTSIAAFALVLGALAALIIVATLIPQNLPPEYYGELIPTLAPVIIAGHLDTVYSSPIFLILLGVLATELLLSTFSLCLTTASSRTALTSTESIVPPPPPQGDCQAYHKHAITNNRRTLLRGILLRCGASAVLIALLISKITSIHGSLLLTPGQSSTLPQAAESLTVTLTDFTMERYSNGFPASFTSQLHITNPEGASIDAPLSVNTPIHFQNWNFYQSGCAVISWQLTCRKSTTSKSTSTIYVPVSGSGTLPLLRFPDIPGHAFLVHRYLSDATLNTSSKQHSEQKQRAVKRSDFPGTGAALIVELVFPSSNSTAATAHTLGWLTPTSSLRTTTGYTLCMGKQQVSSNIKYRRDNSYPLAMLGLAMVIVGTLL